MPVGGTPPRATTAIALAWLIAGCTSSSLQPPLASSSVPSAPTSQSATPTHPSPSLDVDAQPSAPADLAFPAPRDLPIEPPEDATPEEVIDSFHALVHDPAHSYRAEGRARWVVDGVEEVSATSIDHAAGDRHLRMTAATGETSELIVVGGSAAARQGEGEWQAVDPGTVRGLYDLSTALVIGDLGPEPDAAGYRLVIDAGFDVFPRSAAGTGGDVQRVTEVVVDEVGRPMSLTFHQWSAPTLVGETDLPEGVSAYAFAGVGEPVAIPALPVEATTETPPLAAALPTATLALPASGITVELPAPVEELASELTFYGTDSDVAVVELRSVVAVSEIGGRFEAGSAPISADGMTAEERLRSARIAVISRLSGGDLLGSRHVAIAGTTGMEIVADATDEQRHAILYRIRTAFVEDRLIVLSVAGPADVVGSAAADRFLSSLVVAGD